jgi:hypothetical protein
VPRADEGVERAVELLARACNVEHEGRGEAQRDAWPRRSAQLAPRRADGGGKWRRGEASRRSNFAREGQPDAGRGAPRRDSEQKPRGRHVVCGESVGVRRASDLRLT